MSKSSETPSPASKAQPNPAHKGSVWALYPAQALLWQLLFKGWYLWAILIAFCVPAAAILFTYIEGVRSWEKHTFKLVIACLVVLGVAGLYIWFRLFEYKRIRYLFCESGFSVECGINFDGDWTHWARVGDVRVSRSIFEQLVGCGTVIVGIEKSYKVLWCLSNYREIELYFQNHAHANLNNARRINSI